MRRSLRTETSKVVRLVAAIALIAGVVAAPGAPAGAAQRWTIVPSPNPAGPPSGDLSGVSCATATDCFAVGGGERGTLIERWNGTTWRVVASPNPKRTLEATLRSVSCPSASSCFAVGDAITSGPSASSTLIERWDGTRWSIAPSPTPSGGGEVELSGISCSGSTDCFAVGSSLNFVLTPTPTITSDQVIEHWNGATWSIVPNPTASGLSRAELSGVSCPTAANCFAVGSYQGRTTAGALIEHWNGATWSAVANADALTGSHSVASPQLTLGGSSPALAGISCANDSSCFAVGQSFDGALVERWDGSTWSVVDTPTPHNTFGIRLQGVSCFSPTDCSAVGLAEAEISFDDEIFVGESSSPLTEHWNGTTWSIVAQPQGAALSELSGVSCPAATSCAAVGDSALAERWNGSSWSIAPFAGKTSQSHLNQVACPSATSCFAVGGYESNTSTNTLVEHWNGKAWSILPSPNPSGSLDIDLIGIACPTPKSCFAVGYYTTRSGDRPLIEHWNGKAWSIMTSPAIAGAEDTELTSVSCPSATSCNAVGSTISQDEAKPLVEHWNGTRWSVVAAPSVKGSTFQQFIGVSCPSANDCTAVGSYETSTSQSLSVNPLIERWDGKQWSIVTGATPATPLALLITVSCSSATNCVAVGIDGTSEVAPTRTFAERWDGKTWTILKTPTLSAFGDAELVSVSCRSVKSCYAVGGYSSASGDKTLVEHWDGSNLSVAPSPNPPGGSDTILTGIACPTPASCIAVGSYSARNGAFTLTQRGS